MNLERLHSALKLLILEIFPLLHLKILMVMVRLYSPSFISAGLTYSKIITDRVSIGVNAKVINESILDVSATGFALDFGVQYRFPSNLSIGAAVKNVGTNMVYSGGDLQANEAFCKPAWKHNR